MMGANQKVSTSTKCVFFHLNTPKGKLNSIRTILCSSYCTFLWDTRSWIFQHPLLSYLVTELAGFRNVFILKNKLAFTLHSRHSVLSAHLH